MKVNRKICAHTNEVAGMKRTPAIETWR